MSTGGNVRRTLLMCGAQVTQLTHILEGLKCLSVATSRAYMQLCYGRILEFFGFILHKVKGDFYIIIILSLS